jgi:multicomponent Na+:H+ antiporter subunit D
VVLAALPFVVLIAAAAVLVAASRWLPRRAVDAIAIAAATGTLAVTVALLLASRTAPIVMWAGGWSPRGVLAIGISLYIDPIGAGLAMLACALMVGALVYSARYFDAFEGRYHALMLLFLLGMVGFSLTLDLFDLFVWFELMSVAAYALAGYHIEDRAAIQGGINFAITNSLGSFASVFGLAILYAKTGALNLAQLGAAFAGHHDAAVAVGAALVCAGFLAKAAIVPFHFWLADAHAAAPTPVCLLFSGIMVELGLYAVARVACVTFVPAGLGRALTPVLLAAGVATIAVGAVMCFQQAHVKRLLAFSTIAHAGILLVALAAFDARGIAGGMLYLVAHGLTKAALFACAGILLHRFASVNERELHGVARACRGTAVVYALAALSLAGMPPFGTSAARELIDASLRARGDGWVVHVVTAGTIVTAAAVMRAGVRIFLGWGAPPPAVERGDLADVGGSEMIAPRTRVPALLWIPAVVFVVGAAAIACVPRGELLAQAAAFASPATYAHAILQLPARAIEVPAAGADGHAWIASTGGAVALAALSLALGDRLHLGRLARPLRALHRGDVGAYATWLVAGVAALAFAVSALAG